MHRRPAWIRLVQPVAIAAACHALCTTSPSVASAQPKTVTTLITRGSDLFDDQQYEESIQTLSAALMRPGTSKADKIEVYRLLAYNFITLKRVEEADAAVRGLLVLDESFRLPTSESPRFRDFFDATRKKWDAEGKPGRIDEAAPVEKPVTLQHASPPQAAPGSTLKLTGTVTDPDERARGVTLAYRTGTKGKFLTVPATFSMGRFSAQIPASAVQPPLVEYYLAAVDKGGLPLTSRGDFTTPLRVVVPAAEGGGVLTSPWFWIPVGLLVVAAVVIPIVVVTQADGPSESPSSTVIVNVGE